MTQFIKLNTGDTVFDKQTQKVGTIISTVDNKAKLQSKDGEVFYSHPSQLVKVEGSEGESNLKIKVKYFNKDLDKLKKITQGDWIDLRAAETIEMKDGEFKLIPLGVGMKLPEGYEAIVAPRSSTFKNFGIVETNSVGVIDNSYSGNEDQWFFPAYALRDTTISFNDRICQFRIQKTMPEVEIEEVESLDDISRGGHGSTGVE